uniref:Uncharacterized protein n=1 Tax=Odontella aurita TaxID=265563 RepID=A0A6U6GYC5_9STRA|mmetsp:Transcript_44622/g.136115  ORF Transcript_44622/g.136115 Transcript_44622/m.136115 type:complete len:110 (+) Transcript_44622:184-513(+)
MTNRRRTGRLRRPVARRRGGDHKIASDVILGTCCKNQSFNVAQNSNSSVIPEGNTVRELLSHLTVAAKSFMKCLRLGTMGLFVFYFIGTAAQFYTSSSYHRNLFRLQSF